MLHYCDINCSDDRSFQCSSWETQKKRVNDIRFDNSTYQTAIMKAHSRRRVWNTGMNLSTMSYRIRKVTNK